MTLDLSSIPSATLEMLREAIVTKRLAWPASEFSLRNHGLEPTIPFARDLAALPPKALVALCDAVLSERAARNAGLVELVWTGPDHDASEARETAVVVRQLFEEATESVLIAGYAFSHGKTLFAPLAEAMKHRGVTVTMYVDMPRRPVGLAAEAHTALFATDFVRKNWPFDVSPTMYFDPRTIEPDALASLHAKCIVVDERIALVGSANFTERGQERNVEAGLLVRDEQIASRLVGHFRALTTRSAMMPLSLPIVRSAPRSSEDEQRTWTIACLGWGSLVWQGAREPGGPLESEGVRNGILEEGGSWHPDGPELPIEFARLSGAHETIDRQYVSLTILDKPGVPPVPTLWAELKVRARSLEDALAYAAGRLAEREGIRDTKREDWIGRWPSATLQYPCAGTIADWATAKDLDGVVWTALPPKWAKEGAAPTLEEVITKLDELLAARATFAKKYVLLAPSQIRTPFRAKMEEFLSQQHGRSDEQD